VVEKKHPREGETSGIAKLFSLAKGWGEGSGEVLGPKGSTKPLVGEFASTSRETTDNG